MPAKMGRQSRRERGLVAEPFYSHSGGTAWVKSPGFGQGSRLSESWPARSRSLPCLPNAPFKSLYQLAVARAVRQMSVYSNGKVGSGELTNRAIWRPAPCREWALLPPHPWTQQVDVHGGRGMIATPGDTPRSLLMWGMWGMLPYIPYDRVTRAYTSG